MTHRFAAVLGSIAHGIRTVAASLLSFVGLAGLAQFVVPALVVLLVVAAVNDARQTAATLSSRPDVTEATLEEVAAAGDEEGSVWFRFDALVDSTSLSTPQDLGTFFYLARSPDDPSRGILVRSAQNDGSFRIRVLEGTLVADEAAVADAVEALGPVPPGLDVERARLIDETAAGGDAETALFPSDLADLESGTTVEVTGRVVDPATFGVCESGDACEGSDARWLYLLADPAGTSTIVLRSPHPPDELPVRLQGLYLRDTFDLAPVLESEWFAAIDADVPTDRTLRAGSAPPVTVPASWAATIAYAGLAILLAASLLVGYPVFGAEEDPEPRRGLDVADRIDVEISGRLAREGGAGGAAELRRAPGGVERVAVADLALLLWRYGLLGRDTSRREAEERYVAAAEGEGDRLIVHERDQSALVVVGREADGVAVRRGRLHRLGGSVPAVHFRQGDSDAYLVTRSGDERDAVASELAGEATRAPASG